MKRILLVLAITGCGPTLTPDPENQVSALPLEIPGLPPNADDVVELGRLLFWDPILSGEQDIACGTCHHPDFAYADGVAFSLGTGAEGLGPERIGTDEQKTPKSSMTVLNTAYNGLTVYGDIPPAEAPMFWDNETRSLEEQAIQPILSDVEMRGYQIRKEDIVNVLLSRLRNIPQYEQAFERAFGTPEISEDRLATAISHFERSLNTWDTSFDRYMRGEDDAMSEAAKRGLRLFISSGCSGCHSGPMFSDFELHDIGVPGADPEDRALGQRTASLRMVTKTAPYMHNGVYEDLDAVLGHYDDIDQDLDPELEDVEPLGGGEEDLKAFLEAISDGSFDTRLPEQVPSGLPVGGAMQSP